MNAVVMGISPDSLKSHQKFKQKYELPYLLLVDEGHRVADEYDIWKEKVLYGVKYMGVERTTFLIDADGLIVRIWEKVRVDGHAEEVLQAVKSL